MKPNSPKEGPGFHSGRALPPVEKVRPAQVVKDGHKKAVEQQIESNRPGITPSR